MNATLQSRNRLFVASFLVNLAEYIEFFFDKWYNIYQMTKIPRFINWKVISKIKHMRRILINYIPYILIFFTLNCASFLKGNRPIINQNFTQTDKVISYELVGWKGKENKIKATEILKALHKSNRFKEISHFVKSESEWKIQIILEDTPEFAILLNEPVQPVSWMVEKSPLEYSIYLINRIISMSTRLFVPVINVSEDVITFRIWKSNQKIGEYSYKIERWRIFGWISLILIPFDDRKEIKEVYKDYALKFLNDSEKIYEQPKD